MTALLWMLHALAEGIGIGLGIVGGIVIVFIVALFIQGIWQRLNTTETP